MITSFPIFVGINYKRVTTRAFNYRYVLWQRAGFLNYEPSVIRIQRAGAGTSTNKFSISGDGFSK